MKITHFLRQRRQAVTATQVAEYFGVCKRTVYRDIQCLMDAGVPIRGEAGVGYTIDKKYYLPPIAFDADELEAIGLGISMVRQWTDKQFADKADSAFEKIQAVLPASLQGELKQITTYAVPTRPPVPWSVSFSALREYIRARRKIHMVYVDENKQQTHRTLRPLALFFFNPVWLLAGWCEKRQDFRNFRLDRIQQLDVNEETFKDDPNKNLSAYLAKIESCND
ncbi:helix-turn-helix transcriptional regulator [Marinicella litoralis]|uniref:HTH domain-containing protein n=1 Tax=Marinicella litoralis TaxID=644220 RepID=A0A4R6XU28_9GAMM|nr:YafY family protein [Marinicella litoralis]TDR23482.1 HTH domain-containing protein [Marinicella litoralis]